MSVGKKILLAVVICGLLIVIAVSSVQQAGQRGVEIEAESVGRRTLVSTVTTSGNIRAGRTVDISSDVVGRVVELLVREGDPVDTGQILLRVDPTQFQAAVSRTQASLSQSRSQVSQQDATLDRARREFERLEGLWLADSALVSRQELDNVRTEMEVAERQLESLQFGVAQAEAALDEAEENLSKTVIRAPIFGTVTRLNIEEGETVVVGTMNNPGSLLLTISELSTVEAVVQVDETDLPKISLGDSAVIDLDAFPGQLMSGRVTEIGNSAIQSPTTAAASGQTVAIDFEVVITLDSPVGGIRPDLSATADIVTAVRRDVLSIPIISLTVREKEGAVDERPAAADSDEIGREVRQPGPATRVAETDEEGVFLIEDGRVRFVPVEVGITGLDYFEVIVGVKEGDLLVSGPYQQIRVLQNEDRVRITNEETDRGL